jgi:hypothetical protein
MQGCDSVGAILASPQCSLRSLSLDRCNFGLGGITRIIQALAGEEQLSLKTTPSALNSQYSGSSRE